MKYTSKRFWAFVIDSLLMAAFASLLHYTIGVGTIVFDGSNSQVSYSIPESMMIGAVFYGALEALTKGQSVGKMIFKLRTQMDDGSFINNDTVGYGVRGLIKGVLIPISILSFIVVLIDSEGRSIHDMICQSKDIYEG